MKRLKEILYGFLFGISCLIPGFSGGTMLLILGIYESFTGSIAKISKKPFEAIKELHLYGIGAVVGVVLAIFTVVVCLNKFPLITASFFVGLVIATLPMVLRNIKGEKMKTGDLISYLIFFAIALVMAFGDLIGLDVINISKPNVGMIIYLFVLSTIAAATMIVPAASGMTILLVAGLYDPIMKVLNDVFMGLLAFDFSPLVNNLWILIPFTLGVIVGIIGIAKIISKLLKTKASLVWYAILALLVTSPITIYRDAWNKRVVPMMDAFKEHLVLNIILSVVFFAIGFILLTWLDKYQAKKVVDTRKKEEKIQNVA